MMPLQTDTLFCKSHLCVFSALIFHHAVAFLLLTHAHGGQSQTSGQHQPIVAKVGGDITLPCHVKPATDIVDEMMEWSRSELKPRFVHVRRSGEDLLANQNPSYQGRTSVSVDRLKQGDASLMLSKVKFSDEGKYRCFIPKLNAESSVQLVVRAVSSPVISSAGIDEATRGLVLQCESAGWYPEPEVLWLDGEGHVLSAGPTETVRGPDDLYTVSSRVTVDKRHSNSFTCRVQQNHINQTREATFRLPDDFFTDSSGSSASAVVGVIVGVLFVFAFGFLVWRCRQNKNMSKTQHEDVETPREEMKSNSPGEKSEEEPLINTETERDQQKRMEKENNSECLNKETEHLFQREEKMHEEKVEGESINAGTDEDTKSPREETPGPAETETHQEQPEETTSITMETQIQGLITGNGQQELNGEGEKTENDNCKDENKEKNANNQHESQVQSDEETQQNDFPAGQDTKNNLDERGETEKTLKAEEEEEEKVTKSNRENAEENPTVLSPVEGQANQHQEASGQSNFNKKDAGTETKSTKVKTAGDGPTDAKPEENDPSAEGGIDIALKKKEGTEDEFLTKDEDAPVESKTHTGEDSGPPSIDNDKGQLDQQPSEDAQTDVRNP